MNKKDTYNIYTGIQQKWIASCFLFPFVPLLHTNNVYLTSINLQYLDDLYQEGNRASCSAQVNYRCNLILFYFSVELGPFMCLLNARLPRNCSPTLVYKICSVLLSTFPLKMKQMLQLFPWIIIILVISEQSWYCNSLCARWNHVEQHGWY